MSTQIKKYTSMKPGVGRGEPWFLEKLVNVNLILDLSKILLHHGLYLEKTDLLGKLSPDLDIIYKHLIDKDLSEDTMASYERVTKDIKESKFLKLTEEVRRHMFGSVYANSREKTALH